MTTHTQNVATNVCGDLPNTIPVNLDCSLCNIGFPQYGGMIGLSFYGPRCLPGYDPSPSYWLGFETKYAQWKCPNPGQDAEPEPNTWVATGYFGGASTGACTNQYRFDAELYAVDETHITLDVTVRVLVETETGCEWQTYVSWSESLTEIVNADTTKYRGRNFSSPDFVPITVNQIGGKGDPVSFVKSTVGMQTFKLGCGSTGNALPVCGFWDGDQWLTCFRGVVRSTANTSIRDFAQFGFNQAGCGGVSSGGYCHCDTITLTSVAPPLGNCTYNADPQFVTDYGVIGVPGETVGAIQQIQVAGGSSYGIKVVVKQIAGGSIYICTNDNGAGWVVSVATVSKDKGPRILTATRTGFDVWLYCLNFPNDNILPEECSSGGDYPTPGPGDPYWCTVEGCVQSPLQPANAIGGPYATSVICEEECADIPPPEPPYWCVDEVCVQSSTPPAGYTGGPYVNLAACQAASCEPTPVGDYWCLFGYCVQSVTSPDPSATGPYATAELCNSSCEGPPEMVWHCGFDSGCALISKAEAIILGYSYYTTEAECQAVCDVEYWCLPDPDGCTPYYGGYIPPTALGGPYATIELCYESCDNGPGWYCVDGTCGFYPSRPVGATGAKHASYMDCVPECFVLFEGVQPVAVVQQPLEPVTQTKQTKQTKQTPAPKRTVIDGKKLAARYKLPCIHRGSPVANSGFT